MRRFVLQSVLTVFSCTVAWGDPLTYKNLPTGQELADHDRRQEDRDLNCQLDLSLPVIKFEDVALSDIFDFLQDINGAHLIVDWKSLAKVKVERGTQVSLKLRNVKFSKALALILDKAAGEGKVISHVENGVLLISTPEGMPELIRIFKPMDLSNVNPNLRSKLEKVIRPEIDFKGMWLSQVKEFIEDVSGVKIEVDSDFPVGAFEPIGKEIRDELKIRQMHVYQVIRYVFSTTGEPVDVMVKEDHVFIAPVIKHAQR